MSKIDLKKYRKAIKLLNALVGINSKIQTAVIAATIGLGGQEAIREGLSKIDGLCKEWQGKPKEQPNVKDNR